MYFVVYLVELKKNVILPTGWIKDVSLHLEKFINNSLNRSQALLCYFTTNPAAFDDKNCPRTDWTPNFSSMVTSDGGDLDGGFDGCFVGLLQQFKVNYDDAIVFVQKHRDKPPALYNRCRLFEKPIPNIETDVEEIVLTGSEYAEVLADYDRSRPGKTQAENSTLNSVVNCAQVPDDENNGNTSSNQDLDLSFRDENSSESLDENLAQSLNLNSPQQRNEPILNNDELANFDLADIGAENIDNANEKDPLCIDIKPEPLELFNLHDDGFACELDEMEPTENNTQAKEKSAEDSDGDITFVSNGGSFPLPKKFDIFSLMKRENDKVSGDIPFDEKEGDRIYLIGKDRIRVPKRVIDKIIDWNEKQCDDISVDKKIFKSLILCLVTPERLAEGHIDKHVKNFIYACFLVRCTNQIDRINSIETYIDELMSRSLQHKEKEI